MRAERRCSHGDDYPCHDDMKAEIAALRAEVERLMHEIEFLRPLADKGLEAERLREALEGKP